MGFLEELLTVNRNFRTTALVFVLSWGLFCTILGDFSFFKFEINENPSLLLNLSSLTASEAISKESNKQTYYRKTSPLTFPLRSHSGDDYLGLAP